MGPYMNHMSMWFNKQKRKKQKVALVMIQAKVYGIDEMVYNEKEGNEPITSMRHAAKGT